MRNQPPLRSLWMVYMACDIVAVVAAYGLTLYLRFYSGWGQAGYRLLMEFLSVRESVSLGPALPLFYLESAFRIILILCITSCFMYGLLDLYAGRRFLLKRSAAVRVIAANLIALGLYYCYFYARVNTFHPRTVFATIAIFNIVLCLLFRSWLDRLLQWTRMRFNFDECRAVLVGADEAAVRLDSLISAATPQGVRIVDRLGLDTGSGGERMAMKIRESVMAHGAHMIICADESIPVAVIMRIIQLSEELDVAVKVLSREMNVLLTRAKLGADVLSDIPLVHFSLPSESAMSRLLRRAVGAVAAALLLVLLSPLFLVIAVLVRATSRGPAFFVQERIGVNRIPFRMYKFRTMHEQAHEAQAGVEGFNESGAGLFKIKRDPRVTTVGRFLRRFSLDELPQLLNVLKGDMALVGPRPLPRRDFEHYYEDWHYIRHGGLPGLTCLWQVSGRSDIDFHNMCILDVYYLRNRSFLLDLKILMKTALVVLFAKGAY